MLRLGTTKHGHAIAELDQAEVDMLESGGVASPRSTARVLRRLADEAEAEASRIEAETEQAAG